MKDFSSHVPELPGVPSTDLLTGMPTQAHVAELRAILSGRFSCSSRSSIEAALVHWHRVREEWHWPELIETGDPQRGAKLACFVLSLMAFEREPGVFYPSSTIANYVWALCAFTQQHLHADPRAGVIGWRYFMAAVNVMCFVPYEPRRRVPTSAIRSALAAVDDSDFAMVQMAVFVLFLYFTFQRSEFPCPKTYDSLDPAKHLFVQHMQPYHGGFRWAVGATKADPRAERLSADAGPGREWVVVGEVNDSLFDLRIWLQRMYQFYPMGPREPVSPFFRCTRDLKRAYLYRDALLDFRSFLTGHVDDPAEFGLHGIRSEAFVVCSNAVGEEAAVIQGGWKGLTSASRYDRLSPEVVSSMASSMVSFSVASVNPSEGDSSSSGVLRGGGDLGVVAARATAHMSGATSKRPTASLPVGWRRVWHPSSSKRGGYARFVGPCGRVARSVAQAVAMASTPPDTSSRRVPSSEAAAVPLARSSVAGAPSSSRFPSVILVDNLVDHVTEFDRPPTRRPPTARVVFP